MDFKAMTEEFQCPGCAVGMDTKCGKYAPDISNNSCRSHILGTFIMGAGHIALGLPKGFNKPARAPYSQTDYNNMTLRFWGTGTKPLWNSLNVPVWAMEKDGFLFVRTYMPRIDYACVDVIEGGKLSCCSGALNVNQFIEEID